MSYNSTNKLKRIIKIQRITLEHTAKGVTQEWIFINLIQPVFDISRTTYYRYLAVNARKNLKETK